MTAKEVIKNTIEMGHGVLTRYLEDLSNQELLVRSVPAANHIAWQLGHMIASEHMMMSALGHKMPDLPGGFAEAYTPETTTSDDPAKFHDKDTYLALLAKQREATLAALEATSEAGFDQPSPKEMHEYAPTVGAAFNIIGVHELMHAGQFVPVRRKLGKPVTI